MSKTEGPQSEVGSSVGNGSQTIFDGMNALVNEDIAEVEFFVAVTSAAAASVSVCLVMHDFFVAGTLHIVGMLKTCSA